MSNSIRKRRRRPRRQSFSFQSLGWTIRRVAVWQTLYGWWQPWMKPGLAEMFLRKNWKHLECAAKKRFASDVRSRVSS